MADTDTQSGALYRKYRPALFSEVVGQTDAVQILYTAVVKPERRTHAYLLHGPRGTGKTTLARIVVKALNCTHVDRESKEPIAVVPGEPCNRCESCYSVDTNSSLDYLEMDAASNNGVDAMRELLGKINLSSPGRYRIILVDEAHMLTDQASNAFLKALEEPPAHVIFLLATTSLANIIATVKSRCVPVPLKPIRPALLVEQLSKIASAEGLDVPEEVILEAAARGRGSMRDSLSHLEALAATGISSEGDPMTILVDALVSAERRDVLVAVQTAVLEGMGARVLAESAFNYLGDLFLIQMGAPDLVSSPDPDGLRSECAQKLGPRRTVQAMDALGAAVMAMRSNFDQEANLKIHLARYCVQAAQG